MLRWKLASEERQDPNKVLPAPASWVNVRARIEDIMHCHAKSTKANLQRSYLEGAVVRDGKEEPLYGLSMLQPGDSVVIRRKPVDKELYERHTKNRVLPSAWRAMSEAQRIDHVRSLDYNDYVYVGEAVKLASTPQPLAATSTIATPQEDPHVRCAACGRLGHTERWCTHKRKEGFVPLRYRRAPHGVPGSLLFPPREEDMDRACTTQDGRLVVVLTPEEARARRTQRKPPK